MMAMIVIVVSDQLTHYYDNLLSQFILFVLYGERSKLYYPCSGNTGSMDEVTWSALMCVSTHCSEIVVTLNFFSYKVIVKIIKLY